MATTSSAAAAAATVAAPDACFLDEGDEDTEAYSLQAEIAALRLQHERAKSGGGCNGSTGEISALDSPRQPPPSSSERERQQRKEGLQRGMAAVYRNYTGIQMLGRASTGTDQHGGRAFKVRASDFLPTGYNPRKDEGEGVSAPKPPRNKARRSAASARHTPGGQAQTKQQPKQPHPPTGSRGGGSRAPVSASAQKEEQKGQEEAPETADAEAAEEEEEAEYSTFASATEKAAQLAAIRARCLRALLCMPVACSYMLRTHQAYGSLHSRLHAAARRLQRFHRTVVQPALFRRYWRAARWPLAFTVGLRVRRKRRAALRIATMMREHPSVPIFKHLQSFRRRVAVSTAHVRSFLQVNAARREAAKRMWIRQEGAVRRHLALKEKQKMERLKAEQKARLLAQASATRHGKGAGNTHAKWLQRQEGVQLLLARSDVVQGQFRASRLVSDRILSTAAEAETEAWEGEAAAAGVDGEASDTGTVATTGTEAEAELELMDADERDHIIARLVSRKRHQHILNVVQDSQDRTQLRGVVDAPGVRDFLKAQFAPKPSLRRASMVAMTSHMTDGLHRINQAGADCDLPRLQRGFLMLTDRALGAPWARLVYESVQAYMAYPDT